MFEEMPDLLREEESVWSPITTRRVREINSIVYGEFTFFDVGINRLQWERVERVLEYATVCPSRSSKNRYNEYRRSYEVEWADGGLSCQHPHGLRHFESEDSMLIRD